MTTPDPAKKAVAKKTASAQPVAATEHASLAEALVAFQAEMPVVPKNQTATIPGKEGRTGYSYRYADLADVSAAAMPLLTKHGLSFVCVPRRTEGGTYELVGRLAHITGGTLEGPLPLVGRNAQEIGSSMTYARRYLLGTMTGLVTDEDEDGAHAAAAARMQTEPAPNDPAYYAPNGQPWLIDGRPNPDALEPHQRAVWDGIDSLTQDEAKAYNAWHLTQELPRLKELTENQATMALEYVGEMVSARPPA